MNLKKNLVDGFMLFFIVLAFVAYLFLQNMILAFILFVLAISVGWFRRALYRIIASYA